MHEHEARLEKLQSERQEAPKAGRKLAIPGGGAGRYRAVAIGRDRRPRRGLAVGYLPGRGAMAPDGSAATTARIVARAPFLAAQRGDRIGIVGPNGAGKTTLLRTIAGELPPLDGSLTFGHAVQLGYLAQLREAAIVGHDGARRADRGVPGHARARRAPTSPGSCSAATTRSRRSGMLSGGERSRLELALLGIKPSNLLLLDEPTNHLDIPAREAIEAFMVESPATLLVVSHDRRLLETVCEKLWVVDDGAAVAVRRRLPGVADGRRRRLDGRERASRRRRRGSHGARPSRDGGRRAGRRTNGRARRAQPQAPPARRPAVGGRDGDPRAKRGPKLSKDAYRRQRAAVDAELTRLGLRKSHLELALGDPAVAANFVEMRRVTSELADVEQALGAAEDAWLELEERAP